jgi:hypothetical protein
MICAGCPGAVLEMLRFIRMAKFSHTNKQEHCMAQEGEGKMNGGGPGIAKNTGNGAGKGYTCLKGKDRQGAR